MEFQSSTRLTAIPTEERTAALLSELVSILYEVNSYSDGHDVFERDVFVVSILYEVNSYSDLSTRAPSRP